MLKKIIPCILLYALPTVLPSKQQHNASFKTNALHHQLKQPTKTVLVDSNQLKGKQLRQAQLFLNEYKKRTGNNTLMLENCCTRIDMYGNVTGIQGGTHQLLFSPRPVN